ncbi:heterokaryon incompatibility protein-domain-containing protein [Podospora fimiseda]|uniref:Heterokaryon incompatibility protein-domain-containing protein n=1 Tax=Podospora fimiseda TaxID=252190 RepID=A0AAN7GVQ9_9PEZI|nr:heterokaryon incompatibility protein-domain-containing protein [Podospora fimiseda]
MEIRFNACSDTSRFYASELIPSDGACRSKFQLFTELGQHDGTIEPAIGAARSISKESNSSQCFDVIRRWISDCDRHPACASSLGSPNPPTRLLDMWVEDDVVRLHITHGEVDPYIALSHCWGPDGLPGSAKTTRATLDSRMQAIQINTLPKTFRDAISICRELGIRFLWIDSLCIIQQDKEDWEKECSRMRDIYRNSYLTISVTRSRDSSEVCFSTRETRHLSTKVGTIEHEGKSCDVLSRESISHYEMGSSDSIPSQSFPLFSRAWTFQERLLPRRVVHYGALELIWECNTLSDCECTASQELLAGWEWQRGPKVLFSKIMSQPRQGPQFRQKLAVLLRRFSLMKLSFDSDRLPSLSGISQALECEETGEYLAGLWEKELSWMIGWINMGNDACRPSCKPAPPTWSWMSLENSWMSWNYSQDLSQYSEWATAWPNGQDLALRNTTFETLIVQCTIKSASCIPLAKHDAFGRVTSGILGISGRVAPATLRDDHFCERNGIQQRFVPDARSEAYLYEPGQTVHCLMIGMMSEKSKQISRPGHPFFIGSKGSWPGTKKRSWGAQV